MHRRVDSCLSRTLPAKPHSKRRPRRTTRWHVAAVGKIGPHVGNAEAEDIRQSQKFRETRAKLSKLRIPDTISGGRRRQGFGARVSFATLRYDRISLWYDGVFLFSLTHLLRAGELRYRRGPFWASVPYTGNYYVSALDGGGPIVLPRPRSHGGTARRERT